MTNGQEEAARKRTKRTLDTVEAERARQEDTARHRQLRDSRGLLMSELCGRNLRMA